MRPSYLVQCLLVLGAIASSNPALAREESSGLLSSVRLGGVFYLGMAHTTGEFEDLYETENPIKPRLTAGGGLVTDFFFTEMIALATGAGLVGQGWRLNENGGETRTKLLYLQVPLLFKLDLWGFQVGVGVGFDFGLRGKTVYDYEGDEETMVWEKEDWEHTHRRFNIALKANLGYAISLGSIFIVPVVDFGVHLLNDFRGDFKEFTDRHLNVMAGIAVMKQL